MADNLREKASAKYSDAKAKASDAYAKGRDKASEAAKAAKAKAEKAAENTKASAKTAAKKTAERVDSNPLGAIVGGLAIGAIVAAMLPRTKRENELVGGVGKKVRSTARTAASNAQATAKEQLDAMGVNADAAKDQLRNLASKIGEAVTSAGSAAADSIRKH
jgi:ElaB/YqjD/DUF883 family membrane-anchored ribosome-binding protein